MKLYLAGENGKKRIIAAIAAQRERERERDGGALNEDFSSREHDLSDVYCTNHYRGGFDLSETVSGKPSHALEIPERAEDAHRYTRGGWL